jgi:signal transduction histidine kinase
VREDVPVAEPTRLRPPARQPNAWELGTLRWDVFYAIVFVAILLLVESDQLPATSRTAATIALAAMVPWYVAVGRPEMRSADQSWKGPVYLAGLIALFAVAQSQDTNAWSLAFAICPQCFYLLPFRRAMVPVVILNVLGAVLLVHRQPHLAGAVAALGIAAFGIGFSYAYGGFVDRIIDQSNERAELIAQLEATRAELAAANHESGTLAERQRLAGEIHDTLAQGFSSIIVLLQAAEAGLAGPGPADAGQAGPGMAREGTAGPGLASARRQLGLAAQTARENLADARALVGALAPASLASETLPGALRRVTERAGAETGMDVSFDVSGTPRPLTAAFDVALLRVGQEALANVRKHAAAGSVQVLLRYQPAAVSLAVTDDGQGFDPAQVNGGYGLRGMHERLGQAGGRVEVRSTPGAGTSVLAEVPA